MSEQTPYLNLDRLTRLTQGDSARLLKYLNQFVELITAGLMRLRFCLDREDRAGIRQTVHDMGPQLIFFGIADFSIVMEKVEQEYADLPMDDLKMLLQAILPKITGAVAEAERLVRTHPSNDLS